VVNACLACARLWGFHPGIAEKKKEKEKEREGEEKEWKF
jgi:hypothetical protein